MRDPTKDRASGEFFEQLLRMERTMSKWTITITRIGTKDVVEKIEFQGTALEAERKLSNAWGPDYASQPGRFRARLRDAQGKLCMTID